jgi:hypothetical protein
MRDPVFDFHATIPFDFFSAMYFLMARRLFCLLRLRQFFRASCFMLILLARRYKPARTAQKKTKKEGKGSRPFSLLRLSITRRTHKELSGAHRHLRPPHCLMPGLLPL